MPEDRIQYGREERKRHMEDFGFALRVARERRGLTQMEVMRQTGINNKTLSGYENGLSEPDLSTLTTLLKLYRVSADRLLGLEAKNPSIVVTPEESDLLALFRTFSETERSELLLALRAIAKRRALTARERDSVSTRSSE